MGENIRLLFRLLSQPVAAMSAILDRGSLLWASICALAVSYGLRSAAANWTHLSFPFYEPLLVLAVFYVPGILIAGYSCQIGGVVSEAEA